jgi:hypothetical protein
MNIKDFFINFTTFLSIYSYLIISQDLQVFIKRVEKVQEQSEIQFPSAVISVLWENIITLVVRVLIEG